MKFSIALLAAVFAQENVDAEASAAEEIPTEEIAAAEPSSIARGAFDYSDFYGDYYYDDLGNKKKKKKKHPHQEHHHHMPSHHGAHVTSQHGAHSSQAAWSNAVSTQGAHFGFGKGFQYDQDLIGNGRFCWNCYARLNYDATTGVTSTAYDNCFGGIHDGFMEMCVGEEYYCNWEERRYKGVIVAVGGGCKSAHSCLRQMTENFRWKVYSNGAPTLDGNTCKSGNFGDETQNSVCSWCCDAMPGNLNRFSPDTSMLCNHKDFNFAGGTVSPAYEYYTNGDTNNFNWNVIGDLFNGLYVDGTYHGLFRIHDHLPLGSGLVGPHKDNQERFHPRGWTGKHYKGQGQ